VSADDEGLKVTVSYEQEIESDATDTETETETQYTIVFDRVVEYRPPAAVSALQLGSLSNGAAEAFDWDMNDVVFEWPLSEWDDFTPVEEDGNRLGFSVTSPDGIATFSFTVSRSDEGALTANKMKIDFGLKDFPWTSEDTYVALLSKVETERSVEVEGPEEGDISNEAEGVLISFDDAVTTVGFKPFGEYTWKETAEAMMAAAAAEAEANADGEGGDAIPSSPVVIPVVATSAAGDDESIAFSFVGAGRGSSDIYWDPEAGINYALDNSSAPVIQAASVFAVVVGSAMALLL